MATVRCYSSSVQFSAPSAGFRFAFAAPGLHPGETALAVATPGASVTDPEGGMTDSKTLPLMYCVQAINCFRR